MKKSDSTSLEDHLMNIFTSADLENRINASGLAKYQYKQQLIEGLQKGTIARGKTAQDTLMNYEDHIKWNKYCEGVEDKLSRVVWAGIGVISTAIPNYFISNWLRILPPVIFESKEGLYQFAAFSLGAFIIEKRVITGIGNYFERMPPNKDKAGMKKKDYLKLLGGYIISEFPHTRKKGREIIDSYTKEGAKTERERTEIYNNLIRNREAKVYSTKEKEATAQTMP